MSKPKPSDFAQADFFLTLPRPFVDWFGSKGWRPRAHQLELLARVQGGESMLLIAPTGAGKTLAGFLPTLVDLAARPRRKPGEARRGIHTLYISPLKALAVDIERNLERPVAEMGLGIDDRDAHRRHAGAQAPAPEARAARHPADDARATGAADRHAGCRALLRGPRHGDPRRTAFAGHLQARAPAGARPGAAAHACARRSRRSACRRRSPSRTNCAAGWCGQGPQAKST